MADRHKRATDPNDRRFGSETASPFRPRKIATDSRAVQMTVEALYPGVRQGEMVDIAFGHNKARFLVNWVGQDGTPREHHLGLQSLGSGNYVWDVILREAGTSADQPFESEQPQLKLYKAH